MVNANKKHEISKKLDEYGLESMIINAPEIQTYVLLLILEELKKLNK